MYSASIIIYFSSEEQSEEADKLGINFARRPIL
jgi:hypothetical protein